MAEDIIIRDGGPARGRALRWTAWVAAAGAGLVLVGVCAVAWLGASRALYPPWYEHRTPEQGLIDHAMLYNSHPDEWRTRVLGFLARWIGRPG